jgi:hypothetical protein
MEFGGVMLLYYEAVAIGVGNLPLGLRRATEIPLLVISLQSHAHLSLKALLKT